jgi:molybdopterin converting factor small subunit
MNAAQLEIESALPQSLDDLLRGDPRFKPLLEHRSVLKAAVNQKFAGFEMEVKDGDEVAFLPPFSGG